MGQQVTLAMAAAKADVLMQVEVVVGISVEEEAVGC